MAKFVGDGENIVSCFVIVEENEGVNTIATPAVCATSLALVFIDINPAISECRCQNVAVFLAHNLQCFFHGFHCFLVGQSKVLCFDDGHVQVVHIEIDAQNTLAESNVSVERFCALVHCFKKFLVAS